MTINQKQSEILQALSSLPEKYIHDLPLLTDALATKGDFILQALAYLLSKKIPDLSVPVNPLAERSALWVSPRGDTTVVWRNCTHAPHQRLKEMMAFNW